MIIESEYYIEHYGVPGMRWGKRGTRRAQKLIDRKTRLATGQASTKDKLLEANRLTFTKKGATRQLQRGANNQAKINAGQLKVTNALTVAGGVKIKNLNYPMPGDKNAKMDAGQKTAAAFIGTYLAVQTVNVLGKRS